MMGFDIVSALSITLPLLFALLVERLVSVPLLPVEILNKGFDIGNFVVPCDLGHNVFDLLAAENALTAVVARKLLLMLVPGRHSEPDLDTSLGKGSSGGRSEPLSGKGQMV